MDPVVDDIVQLDLLVAVEDLEGFGYGNSIDNAGGEDEVRLLSSWQTHFYLAGNLVHRYQI